MIDLYTAATPNGQKIHIMLEECGLDYRVTWIDIDKGDQFDPAFLKISPNNKIPAIVDHDAPGGEDLPLFESGAILMYLARKTGSPLFPPEADATAYWSVMQWLMFQMGNVGPFFGQAHHFLRFAPEPVPYAVTRYSNETRRLYGVMDKHLATAEYLAADAYTIADIATFPWAARHEWQGVDLAEFASVKRWFDAIAARPAVERGMAVPA